MHSPKQSLLEKTEPRENWEERWSSVSSSLTNKDVYYTLDEVKFGHACDLLKPQYNSALEVGCGSARVSCFFASRGFRSFGLDYSEQGLRVARANFRLIHASENLVRGEANRIPFADGSFDVVFSTGLLEHFEHPEPIVKEMVRVLRPGGLFWSDIEPKKFSLLRAFEPLHFYKLRGITPMYERHFTQRQLFELLKGAGLEEVKVFPGGVCPPLWVPVLPRFTWYLKLHSRLVRSFRPIWTRFEGIRIARWLGFYYFTSGVKP